LWSWHQYACRNISLQYSPLLEFGYWCHLSAPLTYGLPIFVELAVVLYRLLCCLLSYKDRRCKISNWIPIFVENTNIIAKTYDKASNLILQNYKHKIGMHRSFLIMRNYKLKIDMYISVIWTGVHLTSLYILLLASLQIVNIRLEPYWQLRSNMINDVKFRSISDFLWTDKI
jgi:hypothetical protein